jgi:hypothetical protein
MSTRIEGLQINPSLERQTPPGRFGEVMRRVAAELTQGVTHGLGLAAPFIPGVGALSGAVLGTATEPRNAVGNRLTSDTGTVPASLPRSEPSGSDLVGAMKNLSKDTLGANLQLLQLQESIQRENRHYTAISNVMRTKHESAKAAIANLR